MGKKTEKEVNRRDFLKTGAGAAAALTCFTSVGLRKALAQARAEGKPLLTENNVNLHISEASPQILVQRAAEFKRDGKSYLIKYFHATDEQKREIMSMTPEELRMINEAVQKCAAEHKPIKIKIIPHPGGPVERRGEFQSFTATKVSYEPMLLPRVKIEFGPDGGSISWTK
ncbi:MAG TPA: twin-arginine translocation signal domain-containing protein [Blastocatellia bacterium]|nr:twin-arginine translocation signal domain-containing protein [Blastocatellia bacterium]